jgi:integrase
MHSSNLESGRVDPSQPLRKRRDRVFPRLETPDESGFAGKLGVAHFPLYHLRHTLASRLSAGGVSDHFVTLMLRQGDSQVFKRYSQAKLNMMREALAQLDRRANEHGKTFGTPKPN